MRVYVVVEPFTHLFELSHTCTIMCLCSLYSSFPYSAAFGPVLNLIPLAESVVKLKAVCMICFKDAAFTKRLGSEKQVCTSIIQ